MYFFGLSKEEVLSQKHDVTSCKEVSNQNPINMITLFGRQVYPAKRESTKSNDGYMLMKGIDLRLPADHYTYDNFHETVGSGIEVHKAKEASATSWDGKRNREIVIDLEEEPPTTEHTASVSYVTVRNLETKPSILADSESRTNKESGLLDLNRTPADESISERGYGLLQDLNCPYIEETEGSCEKSGIDDGPTPLCSPKRQNVGTASPVSDTSCCTMETNSKIESRRSSSPLALEPSCRTRLEFPVTEVLSETGCCNEEENSSEMIQMAAESLVHISAISYQNQHIRSNNSSSQDQDFQDKADAEVRCCSCDSYELHTLGISETNIEEDLCVSSMAMDELDSITRDNNNNKKKEIGIKLRRGRRMKNFQKEILPSLTSLSRYEIREDINILEAVLRSREYKKMQGTMKDVKFRANPRNKRSSSQRYVGKRRRKDE